MQCRTTHQVSREVSIPDPDVNLDLVAFLMFLPFFAFRCECFWSMLKAPRFDLHVYQQYRGLHHHPRNEITLSPVVNTPASKQASKKKPARPCLTISPSATNQTNPTNTHLPSQSEEKRLIRFRPSKPFASAGLQHEYPTTGSTPSSQKDHHLLKRKTLSMIPGNRKA